MHAKETSGFRFTAPKERSTTWNSVYADGQHIGFERNERLLVDQEVISKRLTELKIGSAPAQKLLRSEQSVFESIDGKPLRFERSARIFDAANDDVAISTEEVKGRVLADGSLQIDRVVGGQKHSQIITLPAATKFVFGAELLIAAHQASVGSTLQLSLFDPELGVVTALKLEFADYQTQSMQQHEVATRKVRSWVNIGGSTLYQQTWLDHEQTAVRGEFEQLGLKVVTELSDEETATAGSAGINVAALATMAAPKDIDADIANPRAGMRFLLEYTGPEEQSKDLSFVEHSEQSVAQQGQQYLLDICRSCGDNMTSSDAELALYLKPSAYVQSDADKIKAAAEAVRDSVAAQQLKDPRALMIGLELFVRGHLKDKAPNLDYWSALQSFEQQTGDCSEHAVLLAAMGRAVGIPTRVVTGFAYVEEFEGRRNVFVSHAWTQAYVEGRWQSFDAALGGFSAGHITLALGNGNPEDYLQSANWIGQIRVLKAEPLHRDKETN